MNSRNLSPQWLQFLKSLGIEFWLPLPLLGLSFWFIGGWLTEHTLIRSSGSEIELQAIQPKTSPAYNYGIASIKVNIYPQKGISVVKIKKLSRTYTQSEIRLTTTHIPHLEAAIARELGLSRSQVKKMMRLMPYTQKK
ncbi:MAG: hypothetical protein AAF915_05605 [Cyanobacteria bacterium P01_D01_bin.50]